MSNVVTNIPVSGLPIYFLEGTVLSFNGNIGYGSQQESTLNVELIEDCHRTNEDGTGSPQQISPVIGSSQYLTAGAFTFGGIITSWNKSKNSGGKTYNVKLTDPRQILENVIIITDSYRGSIDSPNSSINYTAAIRGLNYFNVYAFWEDSITITNGTVNDCGSFGNSGFNQQGMPYFKILLALSYMNPTIYSPTNQPFIVDFQTFPGGLPEYYRVPGPSITLLQLLQDVCDVLGFDFYIYMEQGMDESGQTTDVIKVGLVDLKVEPPSFSIIQETFNGKAIDISFGEELRTDVTRSMVLGEQVHYLTSVNTFLPYFGMDRDIYTDTTKPVVPYTNDNNGFWIKKVVDSLNISLLSPFFSEGITYDIHELDIRCAMASFQSWLLRTMSADTPGSFNQSIRNQYSSCIVNNPQKIKQILSNSTMFGIVQSSALLNIQDLYQNPSKHIAASSSPDLLQDLETIHNWLADLGNTYYGKQYMASLEEYVCFKRLQYNTNDINADGEVLFSSQPTTAGGWTESSMVLDLPDPELNLFKTEDGRIKCFAVFKTDGEVTNAGVE
jgi:hypothetical protein